MTRRDLEQRLNDLEAEAEDDENRRGFFHYEVTPDGDVEEESGFFVWDPEAGAYVNDHGHELPPESKPDSGFNFIV